METVGKRIREIRNKFGMTQKEFGSVIGISYGHLSNIEKDKDKPSIHLLRRISTEFGINLDWIISAQGDMLINIDPIKTQICNIKDLDSSFANVVNHMIDKYNSFSVSKRDYYYSCFFYFSCLLENVLELCDKENDNRLMNDLRRFILNFNLLSLGNLGTEYFNEYDFAYKMPIHSDELKHKIIDDLKELFKKLDF